MTKQELIDSLKDFPNDMEVLMSLNSVIFVAPRKPIKKFIGKQNCIILEPN